jgi:hypothetical protein
MKASFKSTLLTLLLAVGGTASLGAQDIQFGAKFGGGAVVGATGAQESRATMNAAFFAELPLGKTREVFGELNYRVFRSVDHEVTRFGTGYIAGGGTGPIVPTSSVDVRKDNLDGFAFNAGYRQQILDSVFWWQGGLSLAAMTSQQEVTGTITVGAQVEGLNHTPAKRSIRPGLFLGAQAKITPDFFVEANLFGTSYQQVNYVPLSYTGQAAHVETTNKVKVSLDINIGFRF